MGSDLLSDIRREIEDRLQRLRPAVEEYEQLLVTAEALEREQGGLNGAGPGRRSGTRRAGESADAVLREAILGALEHGSHTVAELTVVTGKSTAQVNRELRRLEIARLVAKTEREGKLAWSLATGD
jgi:hypothetical protein